MMELYKETILGSIVSELALFADISILEFLSRYEELFGKYTDMQKLQCLLEESSPVENWDIIQRAKNLALGNQERMMRKNPANPLCSVFSNLSLDGSYPKKMYYTPAVLSRKNTVPCPGYKVKLTDYENVREQFCHEMDLLLQSSPETFDSFLIVLDTLMKKYLWSIPATGNRDEDISLYDYIRTTTAIIAALLKTDRKDIPYVMVAGHFSGIQNYIFSVSKAGTAGVAKRLRSRSFYVNAIVSALAHCIIHKFCLPMTNILMLTGGKFYILLPGTKDAGQILEETEKSVTEFLYKKFRGNLSFELVWEEISDEGICDYSGTITRLSAEIDRKKNQLLKTVLVKDNEWNPEKFIVYHDLYHKSMCKACKSALVDNGQEMCSNCLTDTEIGGKLPKIKQFSFSRNKGEYELLDGYYLNLDVNINEKENYLIMQLNDANIDEMYDKPVTIYYAVNNVPVKNHGNGMIEVKSFDEIASASRGCKKIGILKADVDTLGFLFSEGLQRENIKAGTVSRVNTLSRMLEYFFNGYLHQIIKEKYRNVYCVFAGGDDLFLIGPWNEMPDLAIEINQEFHRYTGFNKSVTLSAAICIAKGNGHISTLAEYCEKKLEQVKKGANRIIYPDKEGRNGVYFLEEVMSWQDLDEQIKKGKDFAKALPNIGAAILRRLGNYSRMYQSYLNDKSSDNLMFLPMFSYDITRNYDEIKKESWFREYCEELYRKASYYQGPVEKRFYYADFSVQYAFNLTKEERKNG